ncbi:MAG: hypothetical protein IPM24_00270 [Bryobacterales bacterium]|nr:hypothetical protein [Bryobacterales bacterium]
MMRILLAMLLSAAFSVADDRPAARPEPAPRPSDHEVEAYTHLLTVRRVYVDRLTGGETAAQMRDLLIASLQATKLFVITENADRADAFLRGAAEDLVYTERHETDERLDARVGVGRTATARRDGLPGVQAGAGAFERSRIEDRRHEAFATVRLVNKDGDVIWSTTQESKGAKYRGSSADVAEKVARKLREDVQRAKQLLQ